MIVLCTVNKTSNTVFRISGREKKNYLIHKPKEKYQSFDSTKKSCFANLHQITNTLIFQRRKS